MSTEKGFDFEHPIHFVERRKLLQTTAAVAAVGVLPVSAASVPKKNNGCHRQPAPSRRFFFVNRRVHSRRQGSRRRNLPIRCGLQARHGLSGCDHCGLGSSPCVYRDDMFELNPHLINCDLVVLSTPLYYFGFSAQLKLVIDRFYAINSQLHSPRQTVLLAAAWNNNDWTYTALESHYETLVRYMGWTDVGRVVATNSGTRSMCESTDFPQIAYELGKKSALDKTEKLP